MSDVGPPQGYTADTEGMSSQAMAINDAAEDAKDEVKDLAPTEITAEEFGTKHHQWHEEYAAGIKALGEGSTGMCTALISFAGKIGSAGSSYAAAEGEQASAATDAGSGM